MNLPKYLLQILLLISIKSFAQNTPHQNFWSRLSLLQPINSKWKAEVELQHRRQNDYAFKSNNAFESNLLSSVRTWLHYQHKPDIAFAISPFAVYKLYPIIINETDKLKSPVTEYRLAAAVDLKHELCKNLTLIDRTSVELRKFNNNIESITRLRNRLGFRYEINTTINLTFFDEVFLNVSSKNLTSFFDHTRLALLLNYKPNKHMRIETGYIHITRLPRNTDEFIKENNFLLHVYFTLSHIAMHHHSKNQHHS